MTKSEQWQYLLDNMAVLSHKFQNFKTVMNKSERLCKTLNDAGIEIPIFSTHENIRKFFTDEIATCPVCSENLKLNSNNIKNGFNKFCSSKCEYISISNRQQGSGNTCHKFDKVKWKKNLSNALKLAIAEGRFTPNITNSWCHNRREFEMNGKIYKVRSSWEENFWRKNPLLKYEKIRVPYYDENGKHSYIVDFVDEENRILYEIKPASMKFIGSVKFKAAQQWAKDNDYKFIVIDEDQKNI